MNTEALKVLKERRSCRSYLPDQIADEALNAVLEAAVYAPTGMGKQSPKIVVVQDVETIAQLSRLNAQILGKDTDPFYGAPTIAIVFADSEIPTHLEDGSLVMGNLLNAAHAAGIAGCWIHRAKQMFETDEGKALMKKWGVGETYVGIGNCILGYPATALPAAKPRKEDYIVRA